jgi:hypothetical protein
MLKNFSKPELTQLANDIANGYAILKYNEVLYLPVNYKTLAIEQPLAPEDRVWIPLTMQNVLDLGAQTSKVMFYSETEKAAFYGMVMQAATDPGPAEPGKVLMVQDDKLLALTASGDLDEPGQDFCPNFVTTPINEDPVLKDEVFGTIVEWLDDSEEDAHSLLSHIATALAPHWSAVKYVLLIGEGRNGKSVLMKMIMHLLGSHNVSHVTRQEMSASKSTCLDLQGRLANIVFDGPASYLKDSGPEKSLIAGEPTSIRRLFASLPTSVVTNALFIEGLNREPKTGDKSLALQKRLVRFQFTRTYDQDYAFEQHMLSKPVLGAFLALLLEHYVTQKEVYAKLKPTHSSQMLQLEQMHRNHPGLAFIKWVDEEDALAVEGLLDTDLQTVVEKFKSWRIREVGDPAIWNDKDVEQQLLPLFITERRSKRINGRPRKVRYITGFQSQTAQFINQHIRGEEEATHDEASDSTDTVVADGHVRHDEPAAAD